MAGTSGKQVPPHIAHASRRQREFFASDCSKIVTQDNSRPFANFQDAVERLLPYHVGHATYMGRSLRCMGLPIDAPA